jgi:predicted DNA-binding ribbon-helix-helix protein
VVIRKRKFSDSRVQKRSVRVGGRKTSLTLEGGFWEGLKEIARERELPLSTLITDIHKQRQHANLSSVIRLYVLDHYCRPAQEKGNDSCLHGIPP